VGQLYLQYEYWFAAFQLVMAMLGMGATLSGKDFREVVQEPRSVTLGLVVQLVAVPLTAYLFLRLFGVEGGVAVGIALIAAVPGGTVSNIFTFLARGNVALSISITGITTLACLFTTPLILTLLISQYLPADFSMPRLKIIAEIALTLLLPLALGMLYLYLYPRTAAVFSRWCIRASVFGILLIVVGSASAGRLDLEALGYDNLLLLVVFTVALAIVSRLTLALLRMNRKDASAIEFEIMVRNVNLGVLLKASIFPATAAGMAALGDIVLFCLLLYGGLQLIVGPLLIWLYRKTGKR